MCKLLYWTFCAQVAGVIAWAFVKAERLYFFPTLLAFACVGLAVPQLYCIVYGDTVFPPYSVEKTLLMVNLCFAAAFLGFSMPGRFRASLDWQYSERKLFWAGAVLSMVGAYWYFKISRLPEEMLNEGMWSGKVIAYNFFAGNLHYGLLICLYVALRKPTAGPLLFLAIDGLLVLDRAVIGGRRSVMLTLFITVACSLWLFRKKLIPRLMFLAIVAVGVLVVNSIGEYRNIFSEGGGYSSALVQTDVSKLGKVHEIPFLENLKSTFSSEASEFTAAVYTIADCDASMVFDFGLSHWDNFVQDYIPAQIVGQDAKERLKVNVFNMYDEKNMFGYEKEGSTSEPGVVDAFRSFWYLGCIKFYVIGAILATLLRAARSGSVNAAFGYILLLPGSLVTISHPTTFFFSPMLHMALFVGTALALVRQPAPGGVRKRATQPESGEANLNSTSVRSEPWRVRA